MLLEVRGVTVEHAGVPALHDVSLEVAAGELVALVGANGSGRTTLLRTVSGLLRPRTGEVLLDGRPLGSPEQVVARGVAHVPQGGRVFARMSVRDNLAVGAHLVRDPRAARARVLAAFPVLAERADQLAGTLSGGEAQQLAVGRALMSGPRLLLLDEPATGLAPQAVSALLDAVREVHAGGTAVLLAEQAEPALAVAERGVVLEAGRVVLRGTAAQLRADDGVRRAHLG